MPSNAMAAGLGALTLAALAGPFVGPSSPADAAHAVDRHRLGVSHDRVGYHESLPRPLFASHRRWIPGEARTATFYVRNRSTDPGDLTMALAHPVDAALDGYLTVSVRGRGQTWQRLDDGEPLPLGAHSLRPGHHAQLTVRAALAWYAPSSAMMASYSLDFDLDLVDARAGRTDEFSPVSQPRAPLAQQVAGGVLLAGFVAASLSVITGRPRRRRGLPRS